jgi:hypothetical protein
MIERKVISRQYHTYFNWSHPSNAGPFFSLFGDTFKKAVDGKLKTDLGSHAAMKAFLELGDMRNVLVHQNYVQVEVSKTPEELVKQFRVALNFLDFLNESLFPAPPLATEAPSTDIPPDPAAIAATGDPVPVMPATSDATSGAPR